jgi:hypothetical protein
VTPPRARSTDEAYLWISRQPCGVCGYAGADDIVESTSEVVDGERVRTYAVTCPGCGERREYRLRMPDQPDLGSAEGGWRFGGDEPSELLDPGEWLELADSILAEVPADLAGLPADGRGPLREELRVARAAIEETMKFIPPGGDAVPPFAFWSATGHRMQLREDWRFDREQLAGHLTDVLRLLAELDALDAG